MTRLRSDGSSALQLARFHALGGQPFAHSHPLTSQDAALTGAAAGARVRVTGSQPTDN